MGAKTYFLPEPTYYGESPLRGVVRVFAEYEAVQKLMRRPLVYEPLIPVEFSIFSLPANPDAVLRRPMTEQEWLTSEDPVVILRQVQFWVAHMGDGGTPVITDRKRRLFACACCRQVWHLLTDERSRRAVEVAERYADGLATAGEMSTFWRTDRDNFPHHGRGSEAYAAWCCCWNHGGYRGADRAAVHTSNMAGISEGRPNPSQADLLRHIIGNPFGPARAPRCPCCDGDAGMRWIDNPDTGRCSQCGGRGVCLSSVAMQLAAALYSGEDAAFALHDALLEDGHVELAEHFAVGCDHCDGRGTRGYCKTCRGTWNKEGDCITCSKPLEMRACEFCEPNHPRGCWALDLILGKE